MLTLRQQALQIVNEVPENLLSDFVTYLYNFRLKFAEKIEPTKTLVAGHTFTEEDWQNFLNSDSGIDPQKAAAFSRLEDWRKQNANFLISIDPKKEIAAALEEKYGSFN